jgi:hypothetical protein
MRHGARRFFGWVTLAAGLLLPQAADASPTYPGLVRDDVKTLTGIDMPCTPPCTLCHRDSQGGRGSVIKPFGTSMMKNGLTYQDPASVAAALGALKANAVDSDADGVADVDELSLGHDPDVAGAGDLCPAAPRYGCGARVARAEPDDRGVLAMLGALFAVAVGGRLIRRRHRAACPRPR